MTAIVIFALIALFVGLRLYAVLGERTGHEQHEPARKAPEGDAAPVRSELPMTTPLRDRAALTEDGDLAYLPMAGPGVRALLAADSSFDVARFLDGAGAAYRMILEAFWKGDLEPVKDHVDAHVYETFADVIAQREKEGLTVGNRLVALDPPVIVEAEVNGGTAEVTVRFEADIAAVTRNSAGDVVAGSMSDAIQSRERWTFRRDVRSANPNWLLVETDDEE